MGRNTAVSLVSYSPVPRDDADRLTKTLAKMTQHFSDAAAQNADLVVFPEICAYLNAPDTYTFETLDGPTLTAMAAAAQAHSVYVVVPQAIIGDGKRRNSSILLDRSGAVVGIYHKSVPTHSELDMGIIPGNETPVLRDRLRSPRPRNMF